MITELKEYEISVIMALFNSRNLYRRALTSLTRQTFRDFELILVDDGSTDEIELDLFPELKANSNFKYIRHSNRKHPLSLNTGIVNSSGKYLTFLDSDDEYETDHLENRMKYFIANPDIDLIHSPATLIGEEKDFYVPDAKDNSKMVHLKDCIIGGTFFGKSKIFFELNGFRDVYSHDSDFFERAKEKFCVSLFDSPTYIYHRDNPQSVLSELKKSL
jgi:glycosyltransferase involved in cell wall biosynthesis